LRKLNDKETSIEYFEVVVKFIMNAKNGVSKDELAKIASEEKVGSTNYSFKQITHKIIKFDLSC